jgi:predicted GNAT family acetyltransferase
VRVLDRPVWSTLTTYHLPLSQGNSLARRFVPDVNLFAAARDDSAEALAALTNLVKPGETVFLAEVPALVIPSGFTATKVAMGVQMLATRGVEMADTSYDIVKLTDEDAPEMLALATLTEPGPFLSRTHAMGSFLGVRIDGRLAAMAGERMRFPGYTEVSGVCTHPDFRGRRLAHCLSTAVASRIQARGEQPFLHAWKSNQAAITLYEKLGFVLRTEVNFAVLRRDEPAGQLS